MRASPSADRSSRRRSSRTLTRALPALAVLGAVITAAGLTTPASAATDPVEARYTAAGPYATTTGSATDSAGNSYTLYYPSNYSALGFKSPIVTWGNGTNASPAMYSTLLTHFASYGFTVIASDLANTGSGREIDAGAHYLVAQNSTPGSVFYSSLDVSHVAAVGHSQGAGGATRAAENDPGLITTLMTFSLPNTMWIGTNPDCPTKADCTYNPAALTQPVFFISTHGFLDSIIASPSTETAFYNSVQGQAALGIISDSDGKAADHNSVQNVSSGGNPDGELGYATAWLEYQLLGNATAATAFTGAAPELVSNGNWPGSACKQ
jgi:pimeloyl-ACP methyl ester carboxylesterase